MYAKVRPMFIARGDTRLVIVTDWRQKSDHDLDAEQGPRGHVLELWKLGRFALGPTYRAATRIALFDYGAKPAAREAAHARAKWVAWLEANRPQAVLVVPTPDSTLGAEPAHLKGTQCWQALRAPDTLDAMRGTRWTHPTGSAITALFPIAKRVKELQRWLMVQWMRAWAMPTLELGRHAIHPGAKMLRLMASMRDRPLAVDLEFHPGKDLITAVGLSDGRASVSIPFDRYTPRNTGVVERGLSDYAEGETIRGALAALIRAPTAKFAHNFTADIPRLEGRGLQVGGPLHDTFAAHAIAFPELRHGLQHAAASLLPVPPWKSIYRPARLARGITRDDAEFWTACPRSLRFYNCRDAYFTHKLAQTVLPYVGVNDVF